MRFTPMDNIPARKSNPRRKNLNHYLDEFMNMNVKYALVDVTKHDYESLQVARCSLTSSIQHYGYPIKVLKRGDNLYFVRKDMDD